MERNGTLAHIWWKTVPQKTKNYHMSSNPTQGKHSTVKTGTLNRYFIVHNSKKMETTQMFTNNEWIKKMWPVY